MLSSVSNTFDPVCFANALVNDASASMMKMLIGSTTAKPPDEVDDLWSDKQWHVTIDLNDMASILELLDSEYERFGLEVSATVSGKAKGVTPKLLLKIWSTDLEAAKRTINVTTQYLKHEESNHLIRRYLTNNRMLQYKRINTHFFMDKFFVTSKAKSYRGKKIMQLFVSDTGLFYVYAMKSKSEIPDAVKAFAKCFIFGFLTMN